MHLQENMVEHGVKLIQNVAQFPLHNVIYAPAKFEVAKSNSLKGDAFKRKYIVLTFDIDLVDLDMLLSTLHIM